MARFGVKIVAVGAILMMLFERRYAVDAQTASQDDRSVTERCQKYSENCDPSDPSCQGVEECRLEGEETAKAYCYAAWKNDSDGYKLIKKGCWMNGNSCKGQKECVEKESTRGIYFCCCEGNMCNTQTNFRPPDSPASTTPTSHTVIREQGNAQRLRTAMYSLVPVLGLAIVIIVIFCMWRCHQRNVYYHRPLPPADPEIIPTPLVTSLCPLQLIELRARGRFGAVWKAQLMSEHVAVKIFPLQDKHSWMTEQEFYNLPHMKHENILHFISAEKRGDNLDIELWLITEFHERGSLCDFLKGHSVTWSEMCKIAESMARGLAFLHDEIPARGGIEAKPAIAHRDFKSKNVLLKNDLTACIADFGLALKFEPGKSPGETHGLVGTRRYMAPEVLEGAICFNRDSFLRIDMYACGLLLWELVTRCKTGDCLVDEYQLPFEEEIGLHPSLEDMQELVVTRKVRPGIKEYWLTHPGLATLVTTVEECWDQDAEARLSAGCVQERIAQLSRTVNVITSSNQTPTVTVIPLDSDMLSKDSSI